MLLITFYLISWKTSCGRLSDAVDRWWFFGGHCANEWKKRRCLIVAAIARKGRKAWFLILRARFGLFRSDVRRYRGLWCPRGDCFFEFNCQFDQREGVNLQPLERIVGRKNFALSPIRPGDIKPARIRARFVQPPFAQSFRQKPDAVNVQKGFAQVPPQGDSSVTVPQYDFAVDGVADFGRARANLAGCFVVSHAVTVIEKTAVCHRQTKLPQDTPFFAFLSSMRWPGRACCL